MLSTLPGVENEYCPLGSKIFVIDGHYETACMSGVWGEGRPGAVPSQRGLQVWASRKHRAVPAVLGLPPGRRDIVPDKTEGASLAEPRALPSSKPAKPSCRAPARSDA